MAVGIFLRPSPSPERPIMSKANVETTQVHPEPHKPLTVVPTGQAYADMKDDFFRWEVVPMSFGGLLKGAKVGAIHMQPGTPIAMHVERGNLIPLSIEESAEAAIAEHVIKPTYAVADLQPPKVPLAEPLVAPSTLNDAMKKDDARLAEIAKAAADAKAITDAEARAKADTEAKLKAEMVAKAKAEMTGEKK
jgi:hypothetical protein